MRRMIFIACLLIALPLLGNDFHVIPVAGHAPGFNGSMWETDVVIHNFQTTPLVVEIALVDSGLGLTDNVSTVTTVTIPAGGTRVLSDLLENHRNRASSMGALLIGSDRPFAVTSRIFNVDARGVSAGQTVSGAHGFLTGTSQRAFIPGLTANANFRSNIGVVAAAGAGAPLVVEVALLGTTGTTLGTTTLTIPASTVSHVQFSSTAITTTPFDAATARIRILSGGGDVTAYASVIDNRTHHATFMSGGLDGGSSGGAASTFASFLRGPQDR
jgi:hypothetical protein